MNINLGTTLAIPHPSGAELRDSAKTPLKQQSRQQNNPQPRLCSNDVMLPIWAQNPPWILWWQLWVVWVKGAARGSEERELFHQRSGDWAQREAFCLMIPLNSSRTNTEQYWSSLQHKTPAERNGDFNSSHMFFCEFWVHCFINLKFTNSLGFSLFQNLNYIWQQRK